MKVTVVTPTYKRPHLLREALVSLQAQTFTDYEALIVNDHPPTAAEVAAVVAAFDGRFRVIQHAENRGLPGARNSALREAKGEIIALLDDDDTWLPEFLDHHVRRHQERPDAALVYSGHIARWDGDFFQPRHNPAPPPPADLYDRLLRGKFTLPLSSIVSVKMSAFHDVGFFDEEMINFEDWDLWCRFSETLPFAHLPTPLVNYRLHLGERETDADKRLASLERVKKKWGHHPEFADFYHKFRRDAIFNASRENALKGFRGKGWRYFKSYLHIFAQGGGRRRQLLQLLLLNTMGVRLYRRLRDRSPARR